MTLRLRPHHLLCILTYAGKGYSQPFVDNFTAIVKRIEHGEIIQIVSGPDDICAPVQNKSDSHCNHSNILERDARSAKDLSDLLASSLQAGSSIQLTAERIKLMRSAFKSGASRAACRGCEWFDFCSTISQEDFKQSQLKSTN